MPSDENTYIDTADGVPAGTQLNGIYEIDERIAMGGMGEVYRGHNIQTGDVVAIKIVLPEFAKDETILALFRKEASVLNHLAHDAIVRYHVFTIDPGVGRPYLAMEYVDGQSLADRINEGPMELKDAKKMVAGIASGMQAAHDAGIIHRDISPDNIILVEHKGKQKPKIIDFGIAKSSGVGGGTLLGGKFAGKYNFVSPEQLGLFEGNVTERSDIYSLGLVAAASILGETLDMSGSQVEVIEKRRVVPDISKIDPAIRPIVEAMLQPDPADRPDKMVDIEEWLFPKETSQVTEPTQIGSSWQAASPHQETVIAPASVPLVSIPPTASLPPASLPPASAPPTGIPSSSASPSGLPPGSSPPVSVPLASMPPVGPASGNLPPQPGVNPYETGAGGQPSLAPEPSFVPHYSPPSPPLPPAAAGPVMSQPKKSRGGLVAGLLIALLVAGGGAAYYTGGLDGILGIGAPVGGQDNTATLSPTNLQPKDRDAKAQPKPPPKEDQVTKPLDQAAAMVDWLKNYNGGACFYASPMAVSENSMQIEGFSTSVVAMEKLEADFTAAHGITPEIQARLIDKNQCAVAEFLQAIRTSAMTKPTLELSSSNVKSGQSLSGELEKIENGSVSLVLIDNEGVIYNLEGFLKKEDSTASFNIKLVDLETRDPLPQLILALSSREGITTIRKAEPELASALLGRILKSIDAGELEVGAVVKYFKLGG